MKEFANYSIRGRLLRFYREQKFCNVILRTIIDNRRIAAHYCILASESDYLESLNIITATNIPQKINLVDVEDMDSKEMKIEIMDADNKKTTGNLTDDLSYISKVVHIEDVTGDILGLLVDYCYTGEINIDEQNVNEIIAAAKKLKFQEILRRCNRYCINKMEPDNCLSIWSLAEHHNLEDAKLYAVGFFCARFVEVINTTEFINLEVDRLKEILEYDEIKTGKEMYFFRAIVRWIKHDFENRKCNFDMLFEFTKILQLTKEYIKGEVSDFFRTMNRDDFFQDVCLSKIMGVEKCARKMKMNKNDKRSIIGIRKSETEYTFSILSLQIEEKDELTWNLIHQTSKKSYDQIFFLNDKVVFDEASQFDIIDLVTGNTSKSPTFRKKNYSLVVFAGSIFLIGGSDEDDEIERYNELTKELITVASMNIPRMSPCCVELSGLIYILGGSGEGEVLHSAECFNPYVNECSFIADMKEDLVPVDATAANGFIYVLDSQSLDRVRVDRYDVQKDSWCEMYSLPSIGSILGISHYAQGLIFAMGEEYIESFHVIDSNTGKSVKLHSVPAKTFLVNGDLKYFPAIAPNDGSYILWP